MAPSGLCQALDLGPGRAQIVEATMQGTLFQTEGHSRPRLMGRAVVPVAVGLMSRLASSEKTGFVGKGSFLDPVTFG